MGSLVAPPGESYTWHSRCHPGGIVEAPPSDDLASPGTSEITLLLRRWAAGDADALDQLMPIVYDQLRRIARTRLRAERSGCSLDTTGLVHEAYLKLAESPSPTLRHRGHFLGLASRVMRHLLVDHALSRVGKGLAAALDVSGPADATVYKASHPNGHDGSH